MTPILSICIPSYNRAKFLPDLLKSITAQYDERVEIVICDNGSVDDTQRVALEWQQKYPRIVYERFLQNVGPDRCFLRSVELGSGTFCWLMGDDDIIEPGGLKRVLDALNENITGITVNRVAYDFHLQKRWMEKNQGLTRDRIFLDAFSCFSSLFVLFGFLSAQIVRRSSWIAVTVEEDVSPYYNAYVLIYIIGRMIQKDPHWQYIHSPCVGWRSGNDSFASTLGRFGRFELDVIGYSTICRGLFVNKKPLYKKVMTKVASLHFFGHIRGLKFQESKKRFTVKSFFLCLEEVKNIPCFWYKLLPVLMMPSFLLKALRPLYRKISLKKKKSQGSLPSLMLF